MRRAMMWFRADLRVTDNSALCEAAAWAEGGVIAVFTVCPRQWELHDWAGVKVDFLLRTLRELEGSLAKLNIPLLIIEEPLFKGVPARLASLARQHGCGAVFANREYEVNEVRRDTDVAAALKRDGIELRLFDDQTAIAPGTVRTGEGRAFTVFTPFKKAWFKRHAELGGAPVLGKPRKQAGRLLDSTPIPEQIDGFESTVDPTLWPAGEPAAKKRLERFIERGIGDYKAHRDSPALAGTSALSPYLAVGSISPRQCLSAALEFNRGKLESGNAGADQWISEIVWREFYKHLIHAFPRLCMGRAFKVETEQIRWTNDSSQFRAWCEGRTGVPIVDAAMRQLLATGWMHNRLRMVAAMYLTKDLFIDWRWGERHFMRHLIDGDLASNNGGWQWSASTGTDAAPYFRVFNPFSQSRTHDPTGAFIRTWIPELSSLDEESIHDPSELPPLARTALNYPAPIADRAATRERVMNAFQSLKARG